MRLWLYPVERRKKSIVHLDHRVHETCSAHKRPRVKRRSRPGQMLPFNPFRTGLQRLSCREDCMFALKWPGVLKWWISRWRSCNLYIATWAVKFWISITLPSSFTPVQMRYLGRMCYANTVPISFFVSVELVAVVNLMMRSLRIKALQRQKKKIKHDVP